MQRALTAFARLFVALVAALPAFAADIQPGQWEIAIETLAPAAQQQTLSQCLTEADARDPTRVLMATGPAGGLGCGLADKRDSGTHMDFSVRCTGGLPLTGHGSVDYTSTTLQGEVTLEFQGQGSGALPPAGISSRMSARRVGECKAGSKKG